MTPFYRLSGMRDDDSGRVNELGSAASAATSSAITPEAIVVETSGES
jgi:hypothetical protein